MVKKVFLSVLVCAGLILGFSLLNNHQYRQLYTYLSENVYGLPQSMAHKSTYKLLTAEDISKVKHPREGLLNIGFATFGFTSDVFNKKVKGLSSCEHFFNIMRKVPEWHISFLYNSFGNNFDCLKEFINNPKARTIQAHLINEVCHRNGNCQGYEFTRGYSVSEYNKLWAANDKKILQKFFDYVEPLQLFFEKHLDKHPNVQCIIGPGLESNVSTDAAKNLVSAARKAFPYCKISWNGMRSTAWNADIIEDHAANNPGARPPCLINLDGEDIDFPQRRSPALSDGNEWTRAVSTKTLRKYAQIFANRCELYYYWTWESNCSTAGNKKNPNQRERDCAHPQVRLVMQLMADEIKWINKNGYIKPEAYNWSYDESLPLQLCETVQKKVKKVGTTSKGGKVKLPSSYAFHTVYVMYKNKVIDIYTLKSDNTRTQKWVSSIKPKKKYPYKTVLIGVKTKVDGTNKTVCWKINDPTKK